TREMQSSGEHPHVSILDKVFVETTGGDLTIKVEDNTATGAGIYSEPVQDEYQTLDDAEFHFVELGPLILLKVKPYREDTTRYLVFSTRSHHVVRIDAIGHACISLPEDHGIIFPGGYYLQDGEYKVFDGDFDGYEFQREIRSPNGEDVLYVFHRRGEGLYALFPYNLIRREVQSPIRCNGYSLFDDGQMVVFKYDEGSEPTRVHPMQVWQTPFVSSEHAAAAPNEAGFLGTLGNADLVRGISDCYAIRRFINDQEPSRQVFEDLIANATRTIDAYRWLGDTEHIGDLESVLNEIRKTADLIVDEFEKVVQIRKRAEVSLAEAADAQEKLVRGLRGDSWERVEEFMGGLTALRTQRGRLITLKDVRYMDLARIDELEQEVIEQFDEVSAATVEFLLRDDAMKPLMVQLETLLETSASIDKTNELEPLVEELERVSEGLAVLSEVAANLQVDDPTKRTTILEGISEVFGHLNRVRATVSNRRKELLGSEGRAEFSAQFKLFSQSVTSALGMADTPEQCDEQLSRLMVQLEELEAKFSEFDEFFSELAAKREEVYEALGNKKQQLVDERQRRVANMWGAADRILTGLSRRAGSFKEPDELNTYFASDPMVLKVRELGRQIAELGDSVKADEVASRLKSAKQDALRGLRDRLDLFEDGDLIRFGQHRFSVNTQPLELSVLPHGDGTALTLTGTDFLEPVSDEAFLKTREFWSQTLPSETDDVYRGEFLAATILFAADQGQDEMSIAALVDADRSEEGLLGLVRAQASDRYQEGYERGVHDVDAAAILAKVLTLYTSAGLLRFAPTPRALAALYWAFDLDEVRREVWSRQAQSFGRLKAAVGNAPAIGRLAAELSEAIQVFALAHRVPVAAENLPIAARYLAEELAAPRPRFVTSDGAQRLVDGLRAFLEESGTRHALDEDLKALIKTPGDRYALARAWLEGWLSGNAPQELTELQHAVSEAAALLATEGLLDREQSAALTYSDVPDLLGQHKRIVKQTLRVRIDEFIERLSEFVNVRYPGYLAYRKERQSMIERERRRLRVDEYKPRVLSSFVRNKLINDVYLPLVGDNLAKQLGAAGDAKRTDLMGLLLLVSPPGYGKTTLMEYIASRLGLVFMKINGPSLGHDVHSLDPAEAGNATARQEVEKINLAFEMGNNVMLYLDDIQHTHPELLQKFISLCDAQRRVEGVWKGVTRTYDLRGKKFCVVMAGNPYTESGDKFQIPDMLANRADTYNLGDILSGKDDVFALSYLENAITSNRVLAPLATREQDDIYRLIRMAQGEEIPTTDLSHGYSGAEIEEIVKVLKHMLAAQKVLLQVNMQYIKSAATDEKFRTEPRFQLQGSYRNMNKLAEKIVPAMNAEELSSLVDDHYTSEAQTLTSGAEHNLLKLSEMRGTLSEEQAARWAHVVKEYGRHKLLGGGDNDPVARVSGQISMLGDHLEGIRDALGQTDHLAGLSDSLHSIRDALGSSDHLDGLGERLDAIKRSVIEAAATLKIATPTGTDPAVQQTQALNAYLERLEAAVIAMGRPQIDLRIQNEAPPGVEELLAQQIAIIERTLVPLVRTTNQQIANPGVVSQEISELLVLLRGVDKSLRAGRGTGVAPIGRHAPVPQPVPTPMPTPTPTRKRTKTLVPTGAKPRPPVVGGSPGLRPPKATPSEPNDGWPEAEPGTFTGTSGHSFVRPAGEDDGEAQDSGGDDEPVPPKGGVYGS
ncbi:MAG: DNA repair ATPase, partial [Nannocystaceae bacterium]|nr:DNA repair ATPase [Nannocystaceae bacterium]